MELDGCWLESILRRWERDRSVSRVLNTRNETVVNKGDNYTSDLTRVVMEVVLGSGKKAARSVIVKTLPTTEARARHMGKFGLFKRETMIYNDVLPLMKNLMDEKGDISEVMWGSCIEYNPYDRMVFEDLRESGYYMADRRKGLNLEHSTIVMKSIAKFHAMSVVLVERELLDPLQFPETLIRKAMKEDTSNFNFGMFYDSAIENLSIAIEKTWEPEWQEIVPKVRNYKGKIYPFMKELVMIDEKKFNVLNHGDCWTNNFLFKYTSEPNPMPVGIKFIDFQMSYYNSIAVDLHYFLATSLEADVREKNFDDLLNVYLEELDRNLKYFGSVCENVPTMEELKSELKRFSPFCFALSCTLLTFMKVDPEDVPDMEEMIKKMEIEQEVTVDLKPFLSKKYKDVAQKSIKWCMENDFL